MVRRGMALLVVVALAAGCSSSPASTSDRSPRRGAGTRGEGATAAAPATTPAPERGSCDDADPSACLLPWPNDRLTRADPTTPTKRRLDLPRDAMPANVAGIHIDPAEWNRNDGFAPASTLITHVDGLDTKASKLPPSTDIASSLAPASPLVIVDGRTGKRVAAWAELDANTSDESRQALLITPAAALDEGTTYFVGLRELRRGDGSAVTPSKAFARRLARHDAMAEATFRALEEHGGVERRDLDVAWSFTVGSAESISGRLRHMWDEVHEDVGDGAPRFTVTSKESSGGVRTVQGRFEMPRYLEGDGSPGSVMNNAGSPDGIPARNGTMTADFLCTVPTSATAAKPAATVIYGHGLLGSRAEVLGIGRLGASVNLTFCAVDYLGMSTPDIASIVASLKDLSTFGSLPDRLQQGHLGFLLLGRLLRSQEGFATDPAFEDAAGKPVIDTGSVSFLGASQGGILGGVASSLTEDWRQVVLAVGGMGYNLLLRRSVDFDQFSPLLAASYPDALDQAIIVDLLEQLWQRGENAGYAQHLTREPYGDVPAKNVLLLEAFGDHQVANVSTEKLARTLRVGRRAPTLAAGRSTAVEPFWAIPEIASLPAKGSGLVVWDFATPAPPSENTPNRAGEDPHGKLSGEPGALALVLSFIRDEQIIDVCDARPCHTAG